MTYPHNPNDGGGWWNRPRGSQRSGDDPCPARGYSESLYCTLKARFGYWSPTFLRIVQSAYGGQIPARFLSLAAKLEREKSWERAELADACMIHDGRPPTITVVARDGRIIDRWRPTPEDWEASR